MSDDDADDGLQALLLPEERRGYRYDAETRAAAAELTYGDAKVILERVVRFSNPTDYDALLLFDGMTRILPLLDLVWYLSFAGAKSSGKTTAARVARFLGHHIIEGGTVSSAGLPAAMQAANGLLLDEVDVLLKKEGGETIGATLRQGTDRSTPYLRMTETGRGKAWKLVPVPVFGPKILTFKRAVDDALASRSDLIRMPRARDPKIRRASTRFRRTLLPVKAWLDSEARRVLKRWRKDAVDEFAESPEFVALSDSLRTDLDRTGQIGDLMLLVGRVYDWPTAGVVQARLGVIEEAGEDETVEEVRRAVLHLFDNPPVGSYRAIGGDGLVLKKSEVKTRIDSERARDGQKPIWGNRLSEALDDLGFEHDQRFTDTDRGRAIKITVSEAARLRVASHLDTPPTRIAGRVGLETFVPSENSPIPPLRPTISEGGPDGGMGPGDGKAVPSLLPPIPPPPSEVGEPALTDERSSLESHHPTSPASPRRRDAGGDPVMEEAGNWSVPPKDRAQRRPEDREA